MRWMKHARRCCPTAPSRHCTALRNQAQVTLHAHEARYSRQHVLRGFGPAAQEKLAAASVLIVGAGGLGSPAAMYLAAAGIGGLTLADNDTVDITNLHRQLLYATPDVGRGKVDAAGDRLQSINPHVRLDMCSTRLNALNADVLVRGHDLVVDASDNFPTRYALKDRKSTRLNSSHGKLSRMPSSA